MHPPYLKQSYFFKAIKKKNPVGPVRNFKLTFSNDWVFFVVVVVVFFFIIIYCSASGLECLSLVVVSLSVQRCCFLLVDDPMYM